MMPMTSVLLIRNNQRIRAETQDFLPAPEVLPKRAGRLGFFAQARQQREYRDLVLKFYRAKLRKLPVANLLHTQLQLFISKMPANEQSSLLNNLIKIERIAEAKLFLKENEEDIRRLQARVFLRAPEKPGEIVDAYKPLQQLENKAADKLYERYKLGLEKFTAIPGSLSPLMQNKKASFYQALIKLRPEPATPKLGSDFVEISLPAKVQSLPPREKLSIKSEGFVKIHLDEIARAFRGWFNPTRLIENTLALFDKTIKQEERLLAATFERGEKAYLYQNELSRYFCGQKTSELEKLFFTLNSNTFTNFIATLDHYTTSGEELACYKTLNPTQKNALGSVLNSLIDRLKTIKRVLHSTLEMFNPGKTYSVRPVPEEPILDQKNTKVINDFVAAVFSFKHPYANQFVEESPKRIEAEGGKNHFLQAPRRLGL